MSYMRVIPRDLFNEANLLKCYGQVYLKLETANAPDVKLEHDGEAFDVHQNSSSGATHIANMQLIVRDFPYYMTRPVNSREPWPLYLYDPIYDREIAVFTNDGEFTPEMLKFLRNK